MVSMAYKQKYSEFLESLQKEQEANEAFLKKSKKDADDARARYREQVAQTGAARGLRRTREQAAIGRIRSGLSPRTRFHREENVGYNPPAGRILSRSREKYRQNTGDTSYEATQRRAVATGLMKEQDAELHKQYRNQAKKKAEYERQARLDVQRNAGYMEDERNNKEKIARYNAAHGGPAKQRVKVHEGGGVSAFAIDNGKAALAGGALGTYAGGAYGAYQGAKAGREAGRISGFVRGAKEAGKQVVYGPKAKQAGKTVWNTYTAMRRGAPRTAVRAKLRAAMAAGGKAGAVAGAKEGAKKGLLKGFTGSIGRGMLRGAGLAMTAYDAYRAGKWMVDQRMNMDNARRDSTAAHLRDEDERLRRSHNRGWDGGAR